MEYFFDASAGVNFGGDFDFAPSGGASMMTSAALPDFAGPSSHLDDHHHHHHSNGLSSSSFSFYGTSVAEASSSSSSGFPATAVDVFDDSGSRSYSPSNEAFPSSSCIVSDGATASASSSLTSLLPDKVSSSSLCTSSNHESPAGAESRRFHDASEGANREESSSLSAASFDAKKSVSSSFTSSSLLNNDSNSDSGIASSSSSTSCVNDAGANSLSSKPSPDEAAEEEAVEVKKEEEEAAAEEEQQHQAPEEPTIDININNVVCSFSVRCHLNLRKVAMEACNTEYNRNRACVKMKLRKPKITASIWNSGKITCIGATSEADSKIGARRVARILMRMGFNVHFCRFRVVNVLASCTLPFAIRLHKFSARYSKECEYEPELHPAATYRIKHPKATLKIFSTGSITITAPLVSHISPSVEHIYPRVQEFRMDEKDKETGEMANLVPKAFVPLNTGPSKVKHIPKGPFHSKFKQVIHQQDLVKKAIQQVKDNESSDEDAMYMGCDDDDYAEEL